MAMSSATATKCAWRKTPRSASGRRTCARSRSPCRKPRSILGTITLRGATFDWLDLERNTDLKNADLTVDNNFVAQNRTEDRKLLMQEPIKERVHHFTHAVGRMAQELGAALSDRTVSGRVF